MRHDSKAGSSYDRKAFYLFFNLTLDSHFSAVRARPLLSVSPSICHLSSSQRVSLSQSQLCEYVGEGGGWGGVHLINKHFYSANIGVL